MLLEFSCALDNNLETWVRSSLDLGHMNVAPSREDVDHLSQPCHASLTVAVKLDLFMLVQVEHILDDADVLDYVKSHADRQDVAQILSGGLTSLVGATIVASLVTRTGSTISARCRLVASICLTTLLGSISGSAILAAARLASGAALTLATISRGGRPLILLGGGGVSLARSGRSPFGLLLLLWQSGRSSSLSLAGSLHLVGRVVERLKTGHKVSLRKLVLIIEAH